MKKIYLISLLLCVSMSTIGVKQALKSSNPLFDANIEALADGEINRDEEKWEVYHREDGGYNCCGGGDQKCR